MSVPAEFEGGVRKCLLRKWSDFRGYGFNLHAEKGKFGQYVGQVDEKSPALAAGLVTGDRIVEVNNESITGESHQEVVSRIKAAGDSVWLLVVNKEADEYCKNNGIVISNALQYPKVIECPETSAEVNWDAAKDDTQNGGIQNGESEPTDNDYESAITSDASHISPPAAETNPPEAEGLPSPPPTPEEELPAPPPELLSSDHHNNLEPADSQSAKSSEQEVLSEPAEAASEPSDVKSEVLSEPPSEVPSSSAFSEAQSEHSEVREEATEAASEPTESKPEPASTEPSEPTPEPTPEPSPVVPVVEAVPAPVAEPEAPKTEVTPAVTPTPPASEPASNAASRTSAADPTIDSMTKMSAAEMREALKQKKRADPRKARGVSAKDKLAMFQKL